MERRVGVGLFTRTYLQHAADEPELRVGRIAIACGLAVNDVRQGAVLLKRGERLQDLEGIGNTSRGNHAAHEDEGITSPIKEPRITRDNRLEVITPDDVQLNRTTHRFIERQGLDARKILDTPDVGGSWFVIRGW